MRLNLRRRNGFSLIELLVALGIIVILTVISIPAIDPIINTSNADSAANALKYSIMSARNTAIAKNETSSVWACISSVMEMGEIIVMGGSPIVWNDHVIDIDSDDTSLLITPTQFYTGSLNTANWPTYWNRFATATYGGVGTYGWLTSHEGALANWYTATIPPGYSGSFSLEAWVRRGPTNRSTDVQYVVTLADSSQTFTSTPFQTSHANAATLLGYIPLQTVDVPQLTEATRFKIAVSKYSTGSMGTSPDDRPGIWVDAIRLNGTLNPFTTTTSTTFKIVGQAWPVNKWQGAYVTIMNPDDSLTSSNEKGVIVAQVASNTADTITANVIHWQRKNEATGVLEDVDITDGAVYLLQYANPEEAAAAEMVGNGSSSVINWTKMPKGIAISLYDAVVTNRRVVPFSFDSTGRATFSNADGYITLKLYAVDDPTDQSSWRFLRVFKNTGRTRVARTIAELD